MLAEDVFFFFKSEDTWHKNCFSYSSWGGERPPERSSLNWDQRKQSTCVSQDWREQQSCSAAKERAAPSLLRRKQQMRAASLRLWMGKIRLLAAGTQSTGWVLTGTTSLQFLNKAQKHRIPALSSLIPPVGRFTPRPALAGTPHLSTWAPCCLPRDFPPPPPAAVTSARLTSSGRALAASTHHTLAQGPLLAT